jgi:type IV pilus assembly protein PilB
LDYWGVDKLNGVELIKGTGCFNCMDTGFKGRIGVYEVLMIDEIIQDMIMKNCTAQEISRAATNSGKLVSLKEDAVEKVIQGYTTLEEAASAVMA